MIKIFRLVWYTVSVLLFISCNDEIQPKSETYRNPIISGFAPDPSICRSGDDYYLINSTFEYFPGIPVYHSTDLVNWKLIANALHDINQNIVMDSINSSAGIHAPTIRYHKELFYIIATNNLNGEMINFIMTAEDPNGPWSNAYILKDAPGIDPSLFFDDNGKVWYTGSHVPPDPELMGNQKYGCKN
jgi:alpha-N-arabinofuranosidase